MRVPDDTLAALSSQNRFHWCWFAELQNLLDKENRYRFLNVLWYCVGPPTSTNFTPVVIFGFSSTSQVSKEMQHGRRH